jgi:swainsonine biosynthesis dioxygenase SwnH1/2
MAIKILDLPQPFDPSYKPKVSITKLPANSPIEEILKVIERDGGVILTDFVPTEELAAVDADVESYRAKTRSTEKSAMHIVPKETLAVPGLVGKSPTMAKICGEHPVLESLRKNILEERFSVIREDHIEENCIDPLLSVSMTFWIQHGAPRQRLHRDDNIHGTRHDQPFDLKKAGQFACMMAGSKSTRENGATMFIPGSHKWDDKRVPRMDEVTFAGKCPMASNLGSDRAEPTRYPSQWPCRTSTDSNQKWNRALLSSSSLHVTMVVVITPSRGRFGGFMACSSFEARCGRRRINSWQFRAVRC